MGPWRNAIFDPFFEKIIEKAIKTNPNRSAKDLKKEIMKTHPDKTNNIENDFNKWYRTVIVRRING